MTYPAGSKIQAQERAKRRRNSARGRKCAEGTIPQVYGFSKETVQEAPRQTWFDRLRARIKTLFS